MVDEWSSIVDALDDKSQSALLNLLGTMAIFSVTAIPPLNYGGVLEPEQLGPSSMDGVVFFPLHAGRGFSQFPCTDNSPVQFLWSYPSTKTKQVTPKITDQEN